MAILLGQQFVFFFVKTHRRKDYVQYLFFSNLVSFRNRLLRKGVWVVLVARLTVLPGAERIFHIFSALATGLHGGGGEYVPAS
jgi:hypothetical protein